nr:hypothetical protein BaRGS_020071 [Batillaria attramentaria]
MAAPRDAMSNSNPPVPTYQDSLPMGDGGEGGEKGAKVAEWIEHTTIHPAEVEDKVSFCKLFMDNMLYVITYCFSFGSFGVCVGFLGPTVFDLGCMTSSDLKEMNWVFFVQLIMTLVGSISAGCLAHSLSLSLS